MKSIDEQMENHTALKHFHEFWRSNSFMKGLPQGFIFSAKLVYAFKGRKIECSAIVRVSLSGYDDGKISVNDNEFLNSGEVHLDFLTTLQEYIYDEDSHALTITGRSPKMGTYSLEILPEQNEFSGNLFG